MSESRPVPVVEVFGVPGIAGFVLGWALLAVEVASSKLSPRLATPCPIPVAPAIGKALVNVENFQVENQRCIRRNAGPGGRVGAISQARGNKQQLAVALAHQQ